MRHIPIGNEDVNWLAEAFDILKFLQFHGTCEVVLSRIRQYSHPISSINNSILIKSNIAFSSHPSIAQSFPTYCQDVSMLKKCYCIHLYSGRPQKGFKMTFSKPIPKVILESIDIRESSLTVDTGCRKYCKYLTNTSNQPVCKVTDLMKSLQRPSKGRLMTNSRN